MKTLIQTSAVLGLSLVALNAHSAVSYGSSSAGQAYVGAKVGLLDTDVANKKTTTYGIYGGYNFDQTIGVEAEYLTTNAKAYDKDAERHEYDARTFGVYGTYRYHIPNSTVYLKGRLGMAKTEVTSKGLNVYKSHVSDKTSIAGGVGAGLQITQNLGVEAGYNYLNADTQVLGVGAYFAF